MPNFSVPLVVFGMVLLLGDFAVRAEEQQVDTSAGDRMIAAYFQRETQKLAEDSLTDLKSWNDFQSRREEYRRQLREMLGLEPLPERTPLRPVVTGMLAHSEFTIEKLHFQSRPGLYVTGNLYVPKQRSGKLPGILYLCGHSKMQKDGASLGNKTAYQHHGAWYARNGYVCLVIDTVQLGEIEGIHHGTYREGMWWWNARGYTPAGVETWNAMRALDYLQSRPEVDAERLGVTGRSGGGAYSWFVTALDDRIKSAVPVAGITNLQNHVVDGCVEGHCDCMYFVNTYRWDFDKLAALAAPRPLLISNTDQDRIFPLDGVVDVYNKTRRLFELAEARDRLGLQIAHGPHEDLQVLQVHAFQWFNHHLKGDDRPITMLAEDFFKPEELKVFDALPRDEINTRVHEEFVPLAPKPTLPSSREQWQAQSEEWKTALRQKCFAGWPAEDELPAPVPQLAFEVEADGARFLAYNFASQPGIDLRLYLLLPAKAETQLFSNVALSVLDQHGWNNLCGYLPPEFVAKLTDQPPSPKNERIWPLMKKGLAEGEALAYIAPRGIGPTAWSSDPQKQTHIRRRFMLLGQTLDGMRVWDVRRAIQALSAIEGVNDLPVALMGMNEMAGIALYAALFEDRVAALDLKTIPHSHRVGPDFLNALRILDVPQTVAMVAERVHVRIVNDKDAWEYPLAVAQKLGWDNLEVGKDIVTEE